MSRFKKNKTREVPAISTASLPDIVFILLFFFMIVTEPPEKQTQLEVDKSELEFKVDMDKSGRQNAYRIYIGFKEKESDVYAEFPQGKKIKISEELRIINLDEVIREIEGGKGSDNNALQEAAETFSRSVLKERGPGSELANFDVILTVARQAPIKTVLEVKQALAEQGFKRVFHRMEEDEG